MLPSTNILYLLIKYFKINNTNKKKYTKHQQHQNRIHQIVKHTFIEIFKI